jgi:CRISPR-associated protein Cmr5
MSTRTREQQRALHAWERVEAVPSEHRDDYKSRVHGLGSAVLREGLAAALTFVEREARDNAAAKRLLGDLAAYLVTTGLPELEQARSGEALPGVVRGLSLEAYMLATREVLKLLVWFRRAVQATFTGKEGGGDAGRAR